MHSHLDDRGFSLMSVLDHLDEIPGQINVSRMHAGIVKAWHRHKLQTDHWVVLRGTLKIGLYNTGLSPITVTLRLAGSQPDRDGVSEIPIQPGRGRAVFLGEHRPGVLAIPAGLWHGGVATGGEDALLLYYVTRRYDALNPDEERRAWDSLDFSWGPEQK